LGGSGWDIERRGDVKSWEMGEEFSSHDVRTDKESYTASVTTSSWEGKE